MMSQPLPALIKRALSAGIEANAGCEYCGLWVQSIEGDAVWVELRNTSFVASRFSIDEVEYFRVTKELERRRWRIVAFIHTHVSSAEFSGADEKAMNFIKSPWQAIPVASLFRCGSNDLPLT